MQKVQPLANRRRLAFKISNERLDLEPELGGILADYTSFAKLAVGNGATHIDLTGGLGVSPDNGRREPPRKEADDADV